MVSSCLLAGLLLAAPAAALGRPSVVLLVADRSSPGGEASTRAASDERGASFLALVSGRDPLAPPGPSVAERFKRAGYETAAFARDLPRRDFGVGFSTYREAPAPREAAAWLRRRLEGPVFAVVLAEEDELASLRAGLPAGALVVATALRGAGPRPGLYDDALRVPLAASGPGARLFDRVPSLALLGDALLAAAGLKAADPPPDADLAFAHGEDAHAVYGDAWGLLWTRRGGLELYEPASDPEQSRNRIAEKPGEAAALMLRLLDHLDSHARPSRARDDADERAAALALRELGYVKP